MNWLNIEITTIRSPEYIGSAPVERAAWLSVLAYCADQENGGRIVGAAALKDRQWQQMCGVTLREVKKSTKLLVYEGNDLIVKFYPLDKEEMVKQKRGFASLGGKAKALAHAKAYAPAERNRKGIGKKIKEKTPVVPKGTRQQKLSFAAKDEEFERFWALIPVRIGKGRARDEWDRAMRTTAAETILAAVENFTRYEEDRRKKDPAGYRPLHPATWLHQERWHDELPGRQKKPAPAPSAEPDPLGWADWLANQYPDKAGTSCANTPESVRLEFRQHQREGAG